MYLSVGLVGTSGCTHGPDAKIRMTLISGEKYVCVDWAVSGKIDFSHREILCSDCNVLFALDLRTGASCSLARRFLFQNSLDYIIEKMLRNNGIFFSRTVFVTFIVGGRA